MFAWQKLSHVLTWKEQVNCRSWGYTSLSGTAADRIAQKNGTGASARPVSSNEVAGQAGHCGLMPQLEHGESGGRKRFLMEAIASFHAAGTLSRKGIPSARHIRHGWTLPAGLILQVLAPAPQRNSGNGSS